MALSFTSSQIAEAKHKMCKFVFDEFTNLRSSFIHDTGLTFSNLVIDATVTGNTTVTSSNTFASNYSKGLIILEGDIASQFISAYQNYVKTKLVEYFDEGESLDKYVLLPKYTTTETNYFIDGYNYDTDFDTYLKLETLNSSKDDDIGRGLAGWFNQWFDGASVVTSAYDDLLGANYHTFYHLIKEQVSLYFDRMLEVFIALENGETVTSNTGTSQTDGEVSIINQLGNIITSGVDYTISALTDVSDSIIDTLEEVSSDVVYQAQMAFSLQGLLLMFSGFNSKTTGENIKMANAKQTSKPSGSTLTRGAYHR